MEVELTPDQQAFLQQETSGRYRSAEDAVRDAMNRWEAAERSRVELLAAIDAGDADFAAGRYGEYTDETLAQLAAELKAEGRSLRDARRRTLVRP